MKKMKYFLWILVGVAASVTLWACKDDVMIDDAAPHPFFFYVEDEAGNDILIERQDGKVQYNEDRVLITAITNRCKYLSINSAICDVDILIYKWKGKREYVMINPLMSKYTKLWIKLFNDDTEEIVFEAKKYLDKRNEIIWIYKGTEFTKHQVTLVRHDDGTYTMKK